MKAGFRLTASLRDKVLADLRHPHPIAWERVGFLVGRGGRTRDGVVTLASDYLPVDDEDYIDDRSVGARIGPGAFRKAMQRAYNKGAQDLSLFHVHEHGHEGQPGFSRTDDLEMRKFVPDFFNAAPAVPHGAIVLSHDQAIGLCWHGRDQQPQLIAKFSLIGTSIRFWSPKP